MVLAAAVGHGNFVILSLILAGAGIVVSIIVTFFVKTREGGNPQTALNVGTGIAGVLMLLISYFIVRFVVPEAVQWDAGDDLIVSAIDVYWSIIAGLVAGVVVGLLTEYYTSESRKPSRQIANASETRAATNIIAGLANGIFLTALSVITLALAIIVSYNFAGLYGIAIAAPGMLSITGIQLAIDAYDQLQIMPVVVLRWLSFHLKYGAELSSWML